MKFSTAIITALGLYLQSTLVSAVEWHYLSVYVPSGAKITQLLGNVIVPPLPEAGTYYLWPGLQPTDGSGVFQSVMDGSSGYWWLGTGWVGSGTQYPWGNAYNVYDGQSITFNYVLEAGDWSATVTDNNANAVTYTYAGLQDKTFNEAVFAIELYGVPWNFGQLAFNQVIIVASGTTQTKWCTESPTVYNTTNWSYYNAQATVSGSVVTCEIQSLILENNN